MILRAFRAQELLIAIAEQKPNHASHHCRNGQRLPRVIVDILVRHVADILSSFTDAVLHVADPARHFRFLVGFVCGFHISSFSDSASSYRRWVLDGMSNIPHVGGGKLSRKSLGTFTRDTRIVVSAYVHK